MHSLQSKHHNMSLVPAVTAILWAGGAGGAPAIIALPVVADFPSLHEFRHFMRDQGLAVPLRRVLSVLSGHPATAVDRMEIDCRLPLSSRCRLGRCGHVFGLCGSHDRWP